METKWGVRVEKIAPKIKIDEKDRIIVNYLMGNSRATLKEIGREVGLSIDGVKDRIEKLKNSGAIERFTILINRSHFGLPITEHIYIRLKNVTDERYKELINYLTNHDRVSYLVSVIGDFDVFIVLNAKDNQDMNRMAMEIRSKFAKIIDQWRELVVAKTHKFLKHKI